MTTKLAENKDMSQKGDFVSSSIAKGMKMHELEHLKEKDRKKIIKLFSRVSEKSYRRGFQQGIVIGKNRIIPHEKLRFKHDIDESPFTDQSGGFTAIERLFIEYPVLFEIGLYKIDVKE